MSSEKTTFILLIVQIVFVKFYATGSNLFRGGYGDVRP